MSREFIEVSGMGMQGEEWERAVGIQINELAFVILHNVRFRRLLGVV